ncbi:MAG: IclR family transcriptional regulator [Burkholderiaceae bacterium]
MASEVMPETGEGMKSLRTALRLLMEFGGDQRDLGVGEVAERCGLSKSQVSKVLAAFADSGLLVQDPDTRRYSVGARMFALGSRFVTHDPLCREAMPVLRSVVESTGHSARLSVLDGDDVLYLLGVEGPLFVDTGWRAGTWLPVHSTAAGRVLLAFMAAERAARALTRAQLRPITERTVVDPGQLRKLIDAARMRGYTVQRGETTPGLGVLAVPIFGTGQQVVGALSVAFPSHLVASRNEGDLAELLHASARVLSQRIGGTVYPFGTRRGAEHIAIASAPRRGRQNAEPAPTPARRRTRGPAATTDPGGTR